MDKMPNPLPSSGEPVHKSAANAPNPLGEEASPLFREAMQMAQDPHWKIWREAFPTMTPMDFAKMINNIYQFLGRQIQTEQKKEHEKAKERQQKIEQGED